MKQGFIPIIAGLALLLATSACDDSSNNQQSSGGSAAPATIGTTAKSTTTDTVAQNVWPPKSDQPVVIASDLTQTNIMVVYDGSGSMAGEACGANGDRHSNALPAVRQFVNAVPADANIGLLVFDKNDTSIRVPLKPKDEKAVNAELNAISVGGGTPLRTAMTKAYFALEDQARKQLGYGRYILLVVTDGEANVGEDPGKVVDSLVDGTPVEVHAVGFCIGTGHSLNQPGRTFYTDAQNPDQLVSGLTAALAEATEDQVIFTTGE